MYIYILIIVILIYYYNKISNFYSYNIYYPELNILIKNHKNILKDILKIKNNWIEWPEKTLYKGDTWKIVPFYAFGKYIDSSCKLCPNIYNIIKKIPNKKTVLLSKLKANTKLDAHMGWADLANYILRCHYGIIVPDNCYIHVMNEKRKIKEKNIIVFDDSKLHYAENNSNSDRIILIIDMPRPRNISKGTSTIKKSNELISLINKFIQ